MTKMNQAKCFLYLWVWNIFFVLDKLNAVSVKFNAISVDPSTKVHDFFPTITIVWFS